MSPLDLDPAGPVDHRDLGRALDLPAPDVAPGPEDATSKRAHASLTAEGPACEAPGCDRRLTPTQVVKSARACCPACRRAAHRARQRDRRLAEVDASITGLETALEVLRQHRAEIAR